MEINSVKPKGIHQLRAKVSLSSLTLVVEAERSGEGGERIEGHQNKETIRDE